MFGKKMLKYFNILQLIMHVLRGMGTAPTSVFRCLTLEVYKGWVGSVHVHSG